MRVVLRISRIETNGTEINELSVHEQLIEGIGKNPSEEEFICNYWIIVGLLF